MAYAPDQPFPKTKGHVIKSKDWNDAIVEVQRLDSAKVNKDGDHITGQLTVAGNVGVGTQTPENSEGWSKTLDLVGISHAKLSVRSASVEARVMAHGGFWGAPAGMVVGTNSNHALSFGTNKATRMTIDPAGRVGIGITSPSRHLHVQASEIHSGGSSGGYSFSNREATSFVEVPGAGERWVWYASGGRARLWSGGDKLSVHTEGGLSHVIVGPGANGKIRTRHIDGKHHQNDNNDPLFLNYDTGQPVWLGFGGASSSLFVSGNVGIGTVSPQVKLHISSGEPSLRIDSTANRAVVQWAKSGALQWDFGVGTGAVGNNDFWFGDFSGYRLVLQKGGNGHVGIGTTAPQEKLHVVGNRIRLDGNGGTVYLRADGSALDLEASTDLYLNNNGNTVHIRKVAWDSSRTFKEDIADFTVEEATKALEDLKPVTFRWKNDEQKTTNVGFIAEDTPAIMTMPDKKAIFPLHLLAILSKVMQEQQRAIGRMRRELDLLSGR